MYLSKINEHLPMKKVLGILLLIFTSLLIVGCSANGAEEQETSDKSESAIRAVIEKEFNGPDRKYKELLNAAMEAQTNVSNQEEFDALQKTPVWENYMDYMTDTYAVYFTENGYDNFLRTAPAFRYSSFDHDYELNASNIEIIQSENGTTLYDFTFQVEYTDENSESRSFNFKGSAIVPEEGKIGQIEYLDRLEDGLLQELQNTK